MSTRRLKRKCFSNYILILCCLSFCLSACISGEITCDECGSGNIMVTAYDLKLNVIAEKELDECGPYSLQVPLSYIGKQIIIKAHCDEDDNSEWSIGDYFWISDFIELKPINEGIDININREITVSIEGEVSCDAYTSGLVSVEAWDEPLPPSNPPISIGCFFPLSEDKRTSYKTYLLDTPIGSEVWVSGMWDKNESGGSPNEGDYVGSYPGNPITLDREEITGIDFDCCQFQLTKSSE